MRLLEVGARLEAEDDCGLTPLHIACMEGHVSLVSFFIDAAGKERLKVGDYCLCNIGGLMGVPMSHDGVNGQEPQYSY